MQIHQHNIRSEIPHHLHAVTTVTSTADQLETPIQIKADLKQRRQPIIIVNKNDRQHPTTSGSLLTDPPTTALITALFSQPPYASGMGRTAHLPKQTAPCRPVHGVLAAASGAFALAAVEAAVEDPAVLCRDDHADVAVGKRGGVRRVHATRRSLNAPRASTTWHAWLRR